MKSKKGTMLLYPVWFGLIIALALYFLLPGSDINTPTDYIGQLQLKLVKESQGIEKAKLFIEKSAEYSAYLSVYNLSTGSGYFGSPGCGKYSDYVLWQSLDSLCYPTRHSLKRNLALFLNKNLNHYIKDYNLSNITIPLDNYDFLFQDELKIGGIASQPIKLNIYCDVGAVKRSYETGFWGREGYGLLCARYAVKPSFTASIDYDLFSAYESYVDQAKSSIESIRECLSHGSWVNTDSKDLEDTCKLSGGDIVKEAKDEEGNFTIAFEITDKLPDNFPTEKEITLKFAVTQKDDIAPPRVSQLSIGKSDNSMSLQWKKNEASDVAKYSIYCSTKNFDSVDDMTASKVSYNTGGQTIKESLSSCNGLALNATTYYIAVTSADEADNELTEVSAKSYTFS